MKIAVASSGLGHVARGIETWALDTAAALAKVGVDVTLFAGGGEAKVSGVGGYEAPVGPASPKPRPGAGLRRSPPYGDPEVPPAAALEAERPPGVALKPACFLGCLRRTDRKAKRLARFTPRLLWRWGLKSEYGWEQASFWWKLWPHLRRGKFDILHVQDPMVANWCRIFRNAGLLTTKEILAHGTEEPAEFIARFDYVQHLAPWHLENAGCGVRNAASQAVVSAGVEAGGQRTENGRPSRSPHRGEGWTAIPNFVDTDVFRPARDAAERDACRAEFDLPKDAWIAGCVAAVKRYHKRIDYLIREFAEARLPEHAILAIAGSRQTESDALVRMADELAPGRVVFLFDLGRDRMPSLYRALDVFVLSSLLEMMPIALIEAMASGEACLTNRHPVLEWMVGPDGGKQVDMAGEGELARALTEAADSGMDEEGKHARIRAQAMFGKDAVVGAMLDYYKRVMESG